jgi:hypothetical protein
MTPAAAEPIATGYYIAGFSILIIGLVIELMIYFGGPVATHHRDRGAADAEGGASETTAAPAPDHRADEILRGGPDREFLQTKREVLDPVRETVRATDSPSAG